HHKARPGIETAVTKYFIKGEIVEDFNQLRVSHRQSGNVTREQFIVVFLCSLVWCHIEVLGIPKQSNEDARPKSPPPRSAIDALLQMRRVSIALHYDLRNSCR